MIRINKWNETFESADTRKRQRLDRFINPVGCNSAGYVELIVMNGEAGLIAFGVFCSLCRYTATKRIGERGVFRRSSGEAQTIAHLSGLLRISRETLTTSLKLLSSPAIRWVTVDNWDAISELTKPPLGENL